MKKLTLTTFAILLFSSSASYSFDKNCTYSYYKSKVTPVCGEIEKDKPSARAENILKKKGYVFTNEPKDAQYIVGLHYGNCQGTDLNNMYVTLLDAASGEEIMSNMKDSYFYGSNLEAMLNDLPECKK